MARKMTITEAKAKLLKLIDDVEAGEEIEITRHGVTVALLAPASGPRGLKGRFADLASTAAPDEDLFSTGVTWDLT